MVAGCVLCAKDGPVWAAVSDEGLMLHQEGRRVLNEAHRAVWCMCRG